MVQSTIAAIEFKYNFDCCYGFIIYQNVHNSLNDFTNQ